MDRLLLLLPTTTYRTEDFLDAARTLGVDIVCASERPSTFEAHAPDHLLTLDFSDPDGAATKVAELAARRPLRAVVGVDDLTTVAAAAIAERLGLRTNAVAAVTAARDKFQMRQCLAAAGVPMPRFRRIALNDDPFLAARGVQFPCVLKPLALSASRGVIRADDVDQFMAAFRRIARAAGARRRRGQRRRRPVPARRGVRPRRRGGARGLAAAAARSTRWRCSTSPTRSRARSSRRRSTSRPRACPSPCRRAIERVTARGLRGARPRRGSGARRAALQRRGPVGDRGRRALDRRTLLADAPLRHRHDARGADPAARPRPAHRRRSSASAAPRA